MNKTRKLIALGLSCLSVLTLVACSGGAKKDENTSKDTKVETSSGQKETEKKDKVETTSSQKDSEKKGKFTIGDKVTFDNVAEYTITNVEWTDERNQFDKSNPDKVLKVTYNVKNLSEEDLPVGIGMTLYAGGKKMESYPNTNTMDTISAGRSIESAVAHFGVTGQGDLELEIKPAFDFKSKAAIVAFTVE